MTSVELACPVCERTGLPMPAAVGLKPLVYKHDQYWCVRHPDGSPTAHHSWESAMRASQLHRQLDCLLLHRWHEPDVAVVGVSDTDLS